MEVSDAINRIESKLTTEFRTKFDCLLVLRSEAFIPISRQSLMETAVKTQQRYDYPRAVGFMDGKHIALKIIQWYLLEHHVILSFCTLHIYPFLLIF